MLFISHENMFTYEGLTIRVNPVNCVGAMGAGLAKQFRERYPDMVEAYTKMCVFCTITPGSVHEYVTRDGSIVMLFATKNDWRKKSEYKYISDGLIQLKNIILKKYNAEQYVIGIPALGCGLGGLEWKKVKGMIENSMSGLDAKIIVFEPKSQNNLNAIPEFRGIYGFLSNFHTCPVMYDGLMFTNAEAAFQSAKFEDKSLRDAFCDTDPQTAKMLGRSVCLRNNWDTIRDQVMEDVIRDKFTRNEHLTRKLLETGDVDLVEGNSRGDTYWGECHGIGENKLGKILMKIRQELKENQ